VRGGTYPRIGKHITRGDLRHNERSLWVETWDSGEREWRAALDLDEEWNEALRRYLARLECGVAWIMASEEVKGLFK
jgi:hypothetical protein